MAKKTLYFDCQCGLESYAITEEDKLTEFNLEQAAGGNIIGNIYKGRVTDILNGMQAAFIDCGLDRTCYISVEDLCPDKSKYEGGNIDIPAALNLNVGDELMVQIVKAPIGKKGAKVTTNISLVGKYSIYMPKTPFVGVSRKITDEELKKSLILDASQLIKGDEGLIVRTAAPYATLEEKAMEVEYFRSLFVSLCEQFKIIEVGDLVYSESVLHVRVLRDIMPTDVEKVYVGTKALYEHVNYIINMTPHDNVIPIILNDIKSDMFYTAGLYRQLINMMQPRVNLPNGAYMIIEQTEALTVVDVNTGGYVGDDNMEDTAYYTNILAAREIARQVRLRNIGGIVVVDFIDMEGENHSNDIVAELEKALKGDRALCNVLPMSKFGLVEFTRKRTGMVPLTMMVKPCKHCHGAGYIRTPEFVLFDMRARLMDYLSCGNADMFVDMSFDLAEKLFSWKEFIKSIQRAFPDAKVHVTPHRSYHDDTIYYHVGDGVYVPTENATLLY